ncbi:OmpH family outer membrane protein [Kordia sp.]|uniref:OmpH family outer membrane protein n=1 Tax=Kordia sp. TaxID=1965332 RepID=UPI0025BEBD5C|nr:OmpH family outer membrane protein [Kordia sp.]MCH2196982.1 OmpH family outer membrane protein [Kordia sp.]
MNKITLPLSIVAIVIALFSIFRPKSSNELVYVDVNKLVEGYKRTEIVRNELQEKTVVLKSNIDSLNSGFQKELKRYEKDRVSMSKKEQELQQELLSNKQQQINNYRQTVQKQFQQEDQKATQTVINDINDYVREYGKTHGYRIIFGAGGNGNIMYAADGTDLTEKVLEGLNSEFKGK